MNTRRKGRQNENRVVDELESDGWLTYQVKGSTKFNKECDIFNLFDVMAIKTLGESPITLTRFIQVKTNQKPNFDKFIEFRDKYIKDWRYTIEVWVYYDRKGFRIWRLSTLDDEFKEVENG